MCALLYLKTKVRIVATWYWWKAKDQQFRAPSEFQLLWRDLNTEAVTEMRGGIYADTSNKIQQWVSTPTRE